MAKPLYLILFTVLSQIGIISIANGADINPHDIFDEVQEQLRQLRIIATNSIYFAFNEIDISLKKVTAHYSTTTEEAALRVEDLHDFHDNELSLIKRSAETDGLNIDSCLEEDEEYLHGLPKMFLDNLFDYFSMVSDQIAEVERDARYRIDTFINEVEVFDFQIKQCGEQFLCLAPLVQLIEESKVILPNKIDSARDEVTDYLESRKTEFSSFSNRQFGYIANAATRAVQAIRNCVLQMQSK